MSDVYEEPEREDPMTSKEHIGIAIRAAKVASTVLQLLGTTRRSIAQLIIRQTAEELRELAKAVDEAEE